MAADNLTLQGWIENIRSSEEGIPWAGPRPLVAGEHLVGRDDEIDEFIELLDFHSVIVLSAASGAGKTSLLKAGLIPALQRTGWTPIVCSKWTRLGDGATPSQLDLFLLRVVEAQGDERDAPPDLVALGSKAKAARESGDSLATFVRSAEIERPIVVLDQFEELIRQNRVAFARAIKWIHNAAAAHDIRVVVSLRVEYLHELTALRREMAPYTYAQIDLTPVTDPEAVSSLIRRTAAGVEIDVASDELHAAVLKAWDEFEVNERDEESELADPRVGLLGVQALLYTLWWHMFRRGTVWVIDGDVVGTFLESCDGRSPFNAALPAAATMKMESCVRALATSDTGELDPYLAIGTTQLVRRITAHLDSDGYKLHREAWELAEKCLATEIDTLGYRPVRNEPSKARDTFHRLAQLTEVLDQDRPTTADADLLATSGRVLAEQVLDDPADFPSGQPWDLDRSEVTSGPMLGLPRGLVLIEELRQFLFAIKWLEASDLIRITGTSDDKPKWVISLIHDGFGPALTTWASEYVHGPSIELARLTCTRGELFQWWEDDAIDAPWPELDAGTVVNVRWLNCEIPRLRIRRTTFLNCDFRGTLFRQCRFEGVQFVNCLLDGVTFDGCTIVGSPATYTGYLKAGNLADKLLAPSFAIDASERPLAGRANAATLQPGDGVGLQLAVDTTSVAGFMRASKRYRGEASDASRLVSHTSGMPALPMSPAHAELFDGPTTVGEPWLAPIPEDEGGLSMIGGRLCSLMFLRTNFEGEETKRAEIALRLVTGTALDVVEHGQGAFKLTAVGSAIRGLTVTGHHSDSDVADVVIDIDDSLVTETWFGEGLSGTAQFTNSIVWHLTNLSSPQSTASTSAHRLAVEVEDCSYAFLANLDIETAVTKSGVHEISTPLDEEQRSRLALFCNRMDYQSSPAETEFERRKLEKKPNLTWPGFAASSGLQAR